MKSCRLILLLIVFLFLSSCEDVKDDDTLPVTYDYEYAVNTDNYELFLDYDFVDTSTTMDHQVTITFTLKDPSMAVNIKIDYQIESRSDILDHTTTFHDHMTNMYGDDPHIVEIEYPVLSSLVDVIIMDVSGTIRTNTYHDLDDPSAEENLAIKTDMIEWLTPLVSNHDELTMSMNIEVEQNGFINRTRAVIIAREDPFYYGLEVEGMLGFVIEKQGDVYYMIELGNFEGVPFYRLIDEASTEDLDFEIDFGLDKFKDTWTYSYEDGAYVVTATATDILSVLAEDDPMLLEILPYVSSDELTLTIETDDENRVMLTTRMETDEMTTTVETTYDYTESEAIDLSGRVKMPVQNPLLITDFTDMTQKTTNHLYESQTANYYVTSFEQGTYVLDVDSLLDVIIYDEDGLVELVLSPNYAFQNMYQNIYEIPAGDYLIEITSRHDVTILYDLEFIHLSEKYDTLPDIDNPDRVVADTYYLILEGEYDYAFLSYDAEKGGMLKLISSGVYPGELYVMDDDGLFKNYFHTLEENVIHIQLRPGENLFYFKHAKPFQMGFDVLQYGSAPENPVWITSEYSDDFLVPYDDHLIRYRLDVSIESLYMFEVLFDDFMDLPVNGKTIQIKKYDENDNLTDYSSMSIVDQREIYLPPGRYELVVLGSRMTAMKMRTTQSPIETETYVEIDLDTLDNLSAYDQNPHAYYETYRTLPGYEKTIVFTLDEPASVLVDRANDISPYGLYDENDENFTYKHLYRERIYHLNAGTYQIRLGINDQTSIREQDISVLIVTDVRVLEDDVTYPYAITVNQAYTFTKDHELDFEVLELTIEETMDLKLNVSSSLFLSIYDEDGKLVRQSYDEHTTITLTAGSYHITIMYIHYAPIGRTIDFEITETVS